RARPHRRADPGGSAHGGHGLYDGAKNGRRRGAHGAARHPPKRGVRGHTPTLYIYSAEPVSFAPFTIAATDHGCSAYCLKTPASQKAPCQSFKPSSFVDNAEEIQTAETF